MFLFFSGLILGILLGFFGFIIWLTIGSKEDLYDTFD